MFTSEGVRTCVVRGAFWSGWVGFVGLGGEGWESCFVGCVGVGWRVGFVGSPVWGGVFVCAWGGVSGLGLGFVSLRALFGWGWSSGSGLARSITSISSTKRFELDKVGSWLGDGVVGSEFCERPAGIGSWIWGWAGFVLWGIGRGRRSW